MSNQVDFERLMRDNGPMIYTLAVRLTGNPVDGQDLAQETFVKAYERLSQFREDSSFGTWVYRICVNLWKNRVRYEKRRFFWQHVPFFSSPEEDTPVREIEADEAPLGSEMEGLDEQEMVARALSQLGAQERALVVMRDMDDKSYEEISEFLGVPLGTVKSRLARSRERLRHLLGPVLRRTS